MKPLRLKTPLAEPPAPRPASSPAMAPPLMPPPVAPVPPPAAAAVRPAGRVSPVPGQFGRYQLLEKIGSGGMAEVFKARMRGEQGFEKIVAIKRIVPHMAANDAFITMFVDEAKLAAQLNHNNITHIYDLGKVDAWHYIAMEFVEGKDLRTLQKLGKERAYPLPPELALFIAAKIANALDYAHRRPAPDGTELNLVHRDVSPQNILISYEGDIKLCDFGIAKAASKVSTTISGALKGKLQYMSPEQAWGKRVDRRSDIFSLGAVLYEMLTGAPLFEGDTDMSVLERVREGDVEPPSARGVEVCKRVDQIVLKALSKNPQDRYQNASEMEKDLHAVLYAFQPTPGPADVAIYVHRLLEASSAPPSGDEIDAAFDAARAMPPEVAPPKKSRGLVIQKTGEFPVPAVPAPAPRERAPVPRREVSRAAADAVASIPAPDESRKSRTGLVAGIGLAAAALVGAALFVTKDRWLPAKPPAPAPASKATTETPPPPAPASVAAPPPALEGPKVIDQKAVEAEARRIGAEREKAARDAAAKQQAAAKAGDLGGRASPPHAPACQAARGAQGSRRQSARAAPGRGSPGRDRTPEAGARRGRAGRTRSDRGLRPRETAGDPGPGRRTREGGRTRGARGRRRGAEARAPRLDGGNAAAGAARPACRRRLDRDTGSHRAHRREGRRPRDADHPAVQLQVRRRGRRARPEGCDNPAGDQGRREGQDVEDLPDRRPALKRAPQEYVHEPFRGTEEVLREHAPGDQGRDRPARG